MKHFLRLEHKVCLMSRDFKGIWIPREIWLCEEVLPLEKMVWAEIHSLYDREKGGCYASNQYLSRFFGVGETYISKIISKLKKLGLIQDVKFDGRKRVIRAVLPPEDFESKPDLHSDATQTCTTVQPRLAPQNNPHIYIDNKDNNKDYTPYNPSNNPSPKKSANAARVCFGSHVKLKSEEYQDLCSKYGEESIKSIIEEMNDYCAASKPKGYKDYAAAIRQWMRKRLDEGVKPKKDRKFAPCSDDNKAYEAIMEGAKYAL